MEFDGTEETSVRDYLRVVFNYKAVIIIFIIIVMSLVLVNRALRTVHTNRASVKLMIVGQAVTDIDMYKKTFQRPGYMISIYAEILKSRTVIDRVVKALKLDQRPIDQELQYLTGLQAVMAARRINALKLQLDEMEPDRRKAALFYMAVARLQGSINISVEQEGAAMFTISASDINPDTAVLKANSISRSVIIYDLEQQITELKLKYGEKHLTITRLQNYLTDLHKTLDGKLLSDLEALGPASIKIIEQARTSTYLGGKSNAKLIIAFFVSIFFSILLVFIFDFIDQSFKSPHDLEKFLNVPVICSIPRRKSKDKLFIGDNNPEISKYTQSFQNLSEQVFLNMKDKKLKTLLITGVDDSQEANSIIANLGIYLSHKGGHKVLIVDANVRHPSISSIFKISDNPGLIDVLKEEIAFEDAVTDMGSNLYVLPTSKPASNPIAFLDSSKMSAILKTTRNLYDLVLFNCADLKHFSDAVILSSKIDGIALIVNEGKVNRQVVRRLISPLEQNNVNIIGAIFNNRTYVIPEIIYKLT
jgi:capsular exopolysaccharide synthesis family protein